VTSLTLVTVLVQSFDTSQFKYLQFANVYIMDVPAIRRYIHHNQSRHVMIVSQNTSHSRDNIGMLRYNIVPG
jgi:hypothetical protein